MVKLKFVLIVHIFNIIFPIISVLLVVYHDDLTDAFILTLKRLMNIGRQKIALIALEKRFFISRDRRIGNNTKISFI